MNLNDANAYEKRIKELEEELEKYKAEYKWLWNVFVSKMGVKA